MPESHDQPARSPDSRIHVLESTPRVLDVLLHPPGWQVAHGIQLITWLFIFGVLLSGPAMMVFPSWRIWEIGWFAELSKNYSDTVSGFDNPMEVLPFYGVLVLAPVLLAFGVRQVLRTAFEWTQLRLESHRFTIRRPGVLWGQSRHELCVEEFVRKTFDGRRKFYQVLALGGPPAILCHTPLPADDADWLLARLNDRLPRSDGTAPVERR